MVMYTGGKFLLIPDNISKKFQFLIKQPTLYIKEIHIPSSGKLLKVIVRL